MIVTFFQKPNGAKSTIEIENVRQADKEFFELHKIAISMEDSGIVGATVYADIGTRADDGTPEEIIVFARGRSCEDTMQDLREKCQKAIAASHDFYKTGDSDAPDAIIDRNGEVVLLCCRTCGKAEAELVGICPGEQV